MAQDLWACVQKVFFYNVKIVQNSFFKTDNMNLPAFLESYLILKIEVCFKKQFHIF